LTVLQDADWPARASRLVDVVRDEPQFGKRVG
jgi:hypothetical protein